MDRNRYRALYVTEVRRRIAEGEAVLAAGRPLAADADALYRVFHTLKGMSAQMGYAPLALLAHSLEDACAALRRGDASDDAELRGVVAEGFSTLARQVAVIEEGGDPVPDSALEERVRAQLRSAASTGFRLLDLPAAEPEAPAEAAPGVDRGLAAVAELLAASTQLRALAGGDPALLALVRRIDLASRALYGRLVESRLVSFATVVPPLRRRVRGLCAAEGKDARLEVRGEDVQVDPEVLGALQGVLAHLVSNAVAHGIEPRGVRRSAGKPRVGELLLAVERRGERLVVTLSDDGAGFDLARLQAATGDFAEHDAVALAMRPTVSSREAVALHAGRGEGLGAARHLVESLGGTLQVETVPGAGSRFRIDVPAVAVPQELCLVEAGGHLLAVPTRHLADEATAASRETPALCDLPVAGDAALVLRDGAQRRVDRVLGTVDALVAPTPFPLDRLPRVTGTTVAPDGRILFVVQPGDPPPPPGASA